MMDEPTLERWLIRAETLCKTRGVRLTQHRRTVLQLLCRSPKPLSAYELLAQMKNKIDKAAPPTIYRALEFLQQQGLAHKLESIHAYVGCSHPDHPHDGQFLICSDCGDVSEVEDQQVTNSLDAASKAAGFQADRPIVELVGTCAKCGK